MKEKMTEPFRKMHWSSRAVLKTGVVLADVLLLAACMLMEKDGVLSRQMAQTAVYLFCEGVVGGLFFDVVAKRMGMTEKKGHKKDK